MISGLKPYAAYKSSGVEWLGEVPEHWEVLPNRALFEEVDEREHPEEPMLSVTITQGVIRQERLLAESSKKDSSKQDKSAYKLVQRGDIAYNKMRAWQGAIGVSSEQGIVSPAYVVERPRGRTVSNYMHYLLRIPAFAKEAERWSYGIASDMWSLRPEHFKMIYACLPPLAEQAAIARYLDDADRRIGRCIQAKEKLVELLEEQRQALVNEAVTGRVDVRTGQPYPAYKLSGVEWLGEVPKRWEVRRLRTAVAMRVSNVDKHVREGETPVRLCNYVDVYKHDCISQRIDFMRATATPEEVSQFRLEEGDVLITKDSEAWDDIGVPAVVTEPADDLISGYHLALLRPIADVLTGGYLLRALQSKGLAHQFHVAAKGVTRYGLSHDGIKSVWLALPPLAEQAAIARYLDDADERIRRYIQSAQRQIDLLKEYRTRLVAEVVTGKLDVREAVSGLANDLGEPEVITGPDASAVTSSERARNLNTVTQASDV